MGKCVERVFKKNSPKPNAASYNNASWYTDTDGFLEHSANRGSLSYKGIPAPESNSEIFWVPPRIINWKKFTKEYVNNSPVFVLKMCSRSTRKSLRVMNIIIILIVATVTEVYTLCILLKLYLLNMCSLLSTCQSCKNFFSLLKCNKLQENYFYCFKK